MDETNDELLKRWHHVKALIAKHTKRRDRAKRDSVRDHLSRTVGSLVFARLTIEDKMRERHLEAHLERGNE